MKNRKEEQHFIKDIGLVKTVINDLFVLNNINSCVIVEFGFGTGSFTKCLMDLKFIYKGYEFDKNLRIDFIKNFIKQDRYTKLNDGSIYYKNMFFEFKEFPYVEYSEVIHISAPPYSELKKYSDNIHKSNGKYVLLVGEKYLSLFNEYDILLELSGNDFEPKSKGQHFLITNINKGSF
jgi:hypothetical protein